MADRTEAGLTLRVHPGARRNQVTSANSDLIDVKIAAPADKGKANAELVSFLAGILGTPKSAVSIVRGDFSHNKVVAVAGMTREAAIARLGEVAVGRQGRLGEQAPKK